MTFDAHSNTKEAHLNVLDWMLHNDPLRLLLDNKNNKIQTLQRHLFITTVGMVSQSMNEIGVITMPCSNSSIIIASLNLGNDNTTHIIMQ